MRAAHVEMTYPRPSDGDIPEVAHLLLDDTQWRRHEAGFSATTKCGLHDTWDTTLGASDATGNGSEFVDCALCFAA